jgi:xanthine dehydrogenase accessory factor
VSDWIALLATDSMAPRPVVRIAVASVRGSAPREVGACMLVAEDTFAGSIGGGKLEMTAIESARGLLASGGVWQMLHVPLGPNLGQCCGGVVEIWLERLDVLDRSELVALHDEQMQTEDVTLATVVGPGGFRQRMLIAEDGSDACFGDETLDSWAQREASAMYGTEASVRFAMNGPYALLLERFEPSSTSLVLFGAGHVGKALVARLAGLPFDVTWVDSRSAMFPDALPANVGARRTDDPVEQARMAPPGTAYLVMTHSHALDYDLCRAILARDDVCFVGLIGSHTKAARFAHRLARDGMAAERIARLVCPIGIAGIDSKRPEAIAIGVAAQLLRLREANWDGAGAHERGRRTVQTAETRQTVVPIVVHRS